MINRRTEGRVPDVKSSILRMFPIWLATLAALVALAVLFWGIGGLRNTGLLEDWDWYSLFDASPSNFLTYVTSWNRPLLLLVYFVGHWLTPDSFVGLNLIGAGLFIAKGCVLYQIVLKVAPARYRVAFFAAILVGIMPADTGLFNTRYYSYQVAVVAYLSATYCLLSFAEQPRWWAMAGAWVMLLLSLGTYETAYPLILATPFLVLLQQRLRLSRLIKIALLWYGVPILMIWPTLRAVLSHNSYQSGLLSQNALGSSMREELHYIFQYLGLAVTRTLYTSWKSIIQHSQPGVSQLITTDTIVIFFIIGAVTLVIVNRWLGRREARVWSYRPDDSTLLRLLGVGILGIGLGFLPYAVLPSHRALTDRVYLFASVGGAVAISAAVCEVARHARRLSSLFAGIGMCAFLGVATLGGIQQVVTAHYFSLREQAVLAQMTSQMPGIIVPSKTYILIFDRGQQLISGPFSWWFFAANTLSGIIEDALRYIYQNPAMHVQLCEPGRGVWGENAEACQVRSNGILLTVSGSSTLVPYARIIAFEFRIPDMMTLQQMWPARYRSSSNNRAVSSYAPLRLIDMNQPLPRRRQTLLQSYLVPTAPHVTPTTNLIIPRPFDDPFAEPFWGYGWDDQWLAAGGGYIYVHLAPDHRYRLAVTVDSATVSTLLTHLSLWVNGAALPLHISGSATQGWIAVTTIPEDVINRDRTATTIRLSIPGSAATASLSASVGFPFRGIHVAQITATAS